MKRQEWTVPYSGTQLAAAATDKKVYHEGRQKWWKEKKEEVIAKIRVSGITVTDSIVDELGKLGYTNNTTMGRHGPVVEIDEAMQAHLSEAQEKVKTHERLVREYAAWEQMMNAHGTAMFNLQSDDWMYFFGK